MLSLRNSLRFFSRKHIVLISEIHSEAVQKTEKNYEEVKIPVPWGHIAGKWWGPQDKRPIFVVHGWQENCGSFDRLIPLLPRDLGFLCVDFPGHGLSSQLPKGIFYHGIDTAIFVRRMQLYFGWEHISLLGHSMGSVTSFMYTCLFPNDVDLLICIDAMIPAISRPGKLIESSREHIEKFIYYDKLNQEDTRPLLYTYDECVNKQYLSSGKSVDLELCKYILERNVRHCSDQPDKYYFTRDFRLKVSVLMGMQHEDILDHARRILCPHMLLKATGSFYYEDKRNLNSVVDLLKHNNPSFEYNHVEGTHHVHLNEPEKVAEYVNPFLSKYAYGDRSHGGFPQQINLPTHSS